MRKTTIFCLCCFHLLKMAGQSNAMEHRHIRTYEDHLQLSLSVKYGVENFYYQNQSSSWEHQDVYVSPGFNVRFNNWGFGLELPVNILSNKNRQADKFKLNFNAFPGAMMINGGISKIKNKQPSGENFAVENIQAGAMTSPQIWQLYINPVYILNSENFSMSALYKVDKTQLKSAGSGLLGMRFLYFKLQNKQNAYKEHSPVNVLHLYQSGFDFGYAYTLKITNKLFLSAALKGNISLTQLHHKSGTQNIEQGNWELHPVSDVFLALTYQRKDFFAAFQIDIQKQKLLAEAHNISNDQFSMQIVAGIRLCRPEWRRLPIQEGY